MTESLAKIEKLARAGYGVAWYSLDKEFYPFVVDGDDIEWWHDPEGCGSEDFNTAVRATYANIFDSGKGGK